MLGSVALFHVKGEQTAVLATDITSQALHSSFVRVPGRAVSFYEGQNFGHERYDSLGIKVVCIRRFRVEVYG